MNIFKTKFIEDIFTGFTRKMSGRRIHELVSFMNSWSVLEFLISLRTTFHTFRPKYRNTFKLQFTDFTCDNSSFTDQLSHDMIWKIIFDSK